MHVENGASGIHAAAAAALAGPGKVAAAEPPVLTEQATRVATVPGYVDSPWAVIRTSIWSPEMSSGVTVHVPVANGSVETTTSTPSVPADAGDPSRRRGTAARHATAEARERVRIYAILC